MTNRTGAQVTIESIDLRVPGFGGGGVQRKDEPLLAGQVVDLPTPYGALRCYAFLVWLAVPGGEEHAVSPVASAADRAAFEQVRPL